MNDPGSRAAPAAVLAVAIALALPLTPSARSSADSPDENEWLTLSGGAMAVLHHAGDEPYAARVLSISEGTSEETAASMGLTTLSPVRAMIASSDEEFARLTHYGAPDWGVGCALTSEGLVVLKSPRIVDYPLQMESVVRHELAHIAVGRVLRGIDVPRWFDEGVAQAVAGEWRLEESGALAGAAASGSLPRLSSLDVGFPSGREDAAAAYAMSFQAVRFLMERSGARSAGELVGAVAASGDFDAAVRGLTGWDPERFDDEFARFLSRRFNLWTIITDDAILFAAVSLLFVAVVVVRVRRSRARMREWADEERRRPPASPDATRHRDSRWS